MRYYFLFFALLWAGCEGEDPIDEPVEGAYSSGVFLCAEGVFNQSSGTVHHYEPSSKALSQSGGCIFRAANGRDLGNVVQSLNFDSAHAYIIVNNAQKIEVVRRSDWKEQAQITGLDMPRYALAVGDSLLFVSQWGADGLTGSLRIYSLPSRQFLQAVPTYKGAERIGLVENSIWLVHAGGYAAAENKIAVIDIETQALAHTLTLPYENPNSLYFDEATGLVWVLCAGRTVYSNYPDIDTAQSTPSALLAYDAQDYSLQMGLPLGVGEQARGLEVYANKAYWLMRAGAYSAPLSVSSVANNVSLLISGNFYGLGIDRARGDLYASRNRGINTARTLRYSTGQGAIIDSIEAGIFVNGTFFLP